MFALARFSAVLPCATIPTRTYVRYGGVLPSKADTIKLNTLAPAPGAKHKLQRIGRGIGSGRGKTSTRGHKGQRAHTSVPVGFEGGQTPLFRRMRKFGFKNHFARTYTPLNLDTLARFLNEKRLDTTQPITMRSLKDAGVFTKLSHGVKLLARGADRVNLTTPIHLEVSQVSKKAKEIIEAAGGSVKTVYFNKLGLRTFLKKDPSEITIKFAGAPRKLESRFDMTRYELPEAKKKQTPATAAAGGAAAPTPKSTKKPTVKLTTPAE